MIGVRFHALLLLAVAMVLLTLPASALTIDNGLSGDGRSEVHVWAGGSTGYGAIDPSGPDGLTDVVYDYFHYVDVGKDGGAVRLDEDHHYRCWHPRCAEHSSSSWFKGASGQTIRWTATSWIEPGSPVYQTRLEFDTDVAFGDVRLISYLDEDVYAFSDDVLIVLGSGANVQLLTLHGSQNVGVAQAAVGLSNVLYLGWAADQFADLLDAIQGAGAVYSIAGAVDKGSSLR